MSTYLDNEFRQVFRNLFYPERVKNLDVDKWVKYCKSCGATSVWMDFKAQAYAYYDTPLLPKDPVLGKRDLVAEFKRAAERQGLKWFGYIAPAEIESLAATTRDWEQRDADGTPTRRTHDPIRKTWFCWNAPGFRDHFARMIGELAARYRPHGFYIDGIIVVHTACYCEACRTQYRAASGKPIPPAPDWQSPDWFEYLRWRYAGIAAAAQLIHEAVHAVDPQISVVFNCPYPWCGWYSGQSAMPARWLDYVGTEIDLTSGVRAANDFTLVEQLAWLVGTTRMLKGGRRSHLYLYFTPKTRFAEAATAYDATLAAGALPCAQEHVRFMKTLFRRTRRCEPYLVDMVSAADTALHMSTLARDAYYHTPCLPASSPEREIFVDRPFFDEMRGALKGLLHNHLPVDLVHLEDGLEDTDLAGFRTLILPNSVCLPPATAERIQAFVSGGGTLIASLETGLRNARGVRTGTDLLWPGSGLQFKADIETAPGWQMRYDAGEALVEIEDDSPATPDQYLVFGERARRWLGEDVALGKRYDGVELKEGLQFPGVPSCHLPARAVEVAADRNWDARIRMRFRRNKAEGWKECPALAVRRWGKGRIGYLNFQFGTLIASTGHEWWLTFIGRVVRELAGDGPVTVQAPACVKVFAWHQPSQRRYVVHLVNELSSAGMHGVQRIDRVPVAAKVRIAWPGVRAVRQVVGAAQVKARRVGRAWSVQVADLEDHVILACQL